MQRDFGDRAFDVAETGGLPELGAGVKHFEDPPRVLGGFLRTLEDDLVAVHVGDHAEASLDLGDVLIVMAEDDRRQSVVIEGEREFGRLAVARRRRALGSDWGNPRNRPVHCSQSGVS